MKTNNTTVAAPPSVVPPVKVDFTPEDRAWITERIDEALASGMLTLGKFGKEFEAEFAKLCGVQHAVSVSGGTSALEIALRSLDVAGKEVPVPTNTFFATAAAVVHAGAIPVFVDMDPESFAIRPEDVEKLITPNTAGIIIVHIAGLLSRRIPDLQKLARDKGIWLLEDAAHAHGSTLNGAAAGSFGRAAAFSFYPTKVMTSGEGGMLVTNDDKIAEEARIYRDQGKPGFLVNAHTHMGSNWRMSEPHAIIGLRHVQRLPEMIADRQRVAAIFDEALAGFENLTPLRVPDGGTSCFYKYIVVLREKRDRKQLKQVLREKYAVSLSGEVYEDPLHKQPVFEPYCSGPLPVAEDLCARHICLPIFSGMEEEQVQQVITALRETVG